MLLHNHPEYWSFRAFAILYPVLENASEMDTGAPNEDRAVFI